MKRLNLIIKLILIIGMTANYILMVICAMQDNYTAATFFAILNLTAFLFMSKTEGVNESS